MSTIQPVVSVDPVAFLVSDDELGVVLWKRQYEPFAGVLALPGVMLESGESVAQGARRALASKAGVAESGIHAQWAGTYDDSTNRDPRGATISLTQIACLDLEVELSKDAVWMPLDLTLGSMIGSDLPFAHRDIIAAARDDVASRITRQPDIVLALLGTTFTTGALLRLFTELGLDATATSVKRFARTHFTEAGRTPSHRGHPQINWTMKESA